MKKIIFFFALLLIAGCGEKTVQEQAETDTQTIQKKAIDSAKDVSDTISENTRKALDNI